VPASEAPASAPNRPSGWKGVRQGMIRLPTRAVDGEDEPVRDAASSRDRTRTAWLCGGAALLAAGLFWLVRGALVDDAFITLSYARNLAARLHWGLIAAEPANAATSPLNVLLLGGATALLRLGGGLYPVAGLGIVFVGSAVAMAWAWGTVAAALRLPLLAPALGLALVLLNPLVLSSTGLEVLLIPTVLVGMLAAAVRGRPLAFGVLAGLAVLTRLDLVVFVVPLALAAPDVRRRLPVAVAAAATVALPWFAWSWWYFGSAIPDTFAIKTVQRSFGPWTFGNGPLDLFARAPLATAVAFAPAVLGIVALLGWVAAAVLRRQILRPDLLPAVALGAAGIGYYAVYARLGVPPYQWYYVPSIVSLSIALCVLLGAALGGGRVLRGAVALPGVALVACLVAGIVTVDVRGGVPWRMPVFYGNWATPEGYAWIGRQLGRRLAGETVTSPGEIGALAYYCECSIVDAFADRGRAVPLIEQRLEAAGPLVRPLLELNYLRLDRDLQPRPARYNLIWAFGPPTATDQWPTWSPTMGHGHLRLEEQPGG